MKNSLSRITGAILLAFALGSTSQAAPITGQIDLAGGATFDTNFLATATLVDAWNNVMVTSVTGALDTTINTGDPVTMTAVDWTFNSGPHPSLWSVGGFTFNLTSSAIITQTTNFLNVQGVGTLVGPAGFDPTPGTWFFTSQGSGTGVNNQFSFSATSEAVPGVPDGGTTALLLGVSLVAVGVAFRRFGSTRA